MAGISHTQSGLLGAAWADDHVRTRSGVTVPVRATARRPRWPDLPSPVRIEIGQRCGAPVVGDWSAGTGFTPGFASRLDLAGVRRVFVKATSEGYDLHARWPLSDAYREEACKLSALGPDIGSPALLWSADLALGGEQSVLLAFEFVDGRPPRRPWRADELRLVLDRLAQVAPALAGGDRGLALPGVVEEAVLGYEGRLDRAAASIAADEGGVHLGSKQLDASWFDTLRRLCDFARDALVGGSVVHLDLRDDNVLVDAGGQVWSVDWNFPALGAPWIDLACILLSARGDGHDADSLWDAHPLARGADPVALDALLAVPWSYWAAAMLDPVPPHSPHLRDHQTWYAEVTEGWLRSRLGLPGDRASR